MSKKHNSTYTIVFISVVSLVFALLLSIVASALQGKIAANEEAAVLGKILASFGAKPFEADLKAMNKAGLDGIETKGLNDFSLTNSEISDTFKKRIQVRLVSIDGRLLKTVKPEEFDVTKYVPWERLAEVASAPADKQVELLKAIELPVYCLVDAEGNVESYTLPVWGKGLWGPIYGYIALNPDAKTIKGATFSAPKETPGLGLEIENPPFRANWPGKTIFDGGKLTPIEVTKAGAAAASDPDKVDGVSGATLTCRGVSAMMSDSLNYYENYLKTLNKEGK